MRVDAALVVASGWDLISCVPHLPISPGTLRVSMLTFYSYMGDNFLPVRVTAIAGAELAIIGCCRSQAVTTT